MAFPYNYSALFFVCNPPPPPYAEKFVKNQTNILLSFNTVFKSDILETNQFLDIPKTV